MKKEILFVLFFLAVSKVGASEIPSGMTYQGRVLKSNGTDPLESPVVVFKFQIRSPDGLCLLFEETHTRDMTGTGGIFSLNVGEGTNSGATAYSLNQVFDQSLAKTGQGGCTYTPLSGDSLRFRFSYDDGVELVSLPTDQYVKSVPYAFHASRLEGLGKSQFLQVSTAATQAHVESLTAKTTELLDLANGTSSIYSKSSELPISGGVLNLSSSGVRVADVPGGNDYAVNKNYTDSYIGGRTLDLTSLGDGQSLVWNQSLSKWVGGTATLPSIGTAGTYTKVTTDSYGRVTSGASLVESDLPGLTSAGKVSGDTITSGTIAGSAAFNSSGAITTSSSVTASGVSATSVHAQLLRLFDSDNSHKVTFSVPTVLSSDLALVFPGSSGSSGQVLTTDGSGTLSWANVSASGSAGGDLSGSYPNPSVSKLQGVSVSSSAPVSGQYYKYGGVQLAPAYINISDLKTSLGSSQIPDSCTSSQTMTYSAITDQFSCANISLNSSQIPSLSWNKITSDLPTTLSGYGITDSIKNGNGVSEMQSGLEASRPAFGSSGRVYIATDTAKIYRDDGSAWTLIASATGTGGTVTSVASGVGMTSATITSSGTLNVDVGTSANQIVQLDSSARLPAVDGSQLTNLSLPPFSNMQVIDSSATWTPAVGVTKVYVQVWGGGGGGAGGNNGVSGGGGSGGAAGAYAAGIFTVTPLLGISVTIGSGGGKGSVNANGSSGGTTQFGALISSGGGAGGVVASSVPTLGGITGAVLGVVGGSGLPAMGNYGGVGGVSPNGGMGGAPSYVGSQAASSGGVPGGGGGGGYGVLASASQGGNGASGRVVIWW